MVPISSPIDLYSKHRRWVFLVVLFLIGTSNYMDRNIISVLLEPIKKEFGVSDTLLGLLSGASFAVLYAALGIPVARWADRGDRKLIITISLTIWSAMTALCGAVGSFWQLALVRVGVGVGEAGAIPPSQSLIVDYFPAAQRARAIAIFMSSSLAGYLIGFVLGAHIAATLGWRWAFFLAGMPGILIALLSWFLLDEPRRVLGYPAATSARESFSDSLRSLWRKPSYRYLVIGVTVYAFFGYGALIFIPSFLVRARGIDMELIGTAYGGISAASALVGTIGGGILADRLIARDKRWSMGVPALGSLLSFPIYLGSLLVSDFNTFLALSFVGGIFLDGSLPAVFVAAHAVCGSARRTVSIAILFLFMSLVGSTTGPLTTGVISDLLQPAYGNQGLAYALMLMTASIPLLALLLYKGSRTILSDIEP